MTARRSIIAITLIAATAPLFPLSASAQVLGPPRSAQEDPAIGRAMREPTEALRRLGLTPLSQISRKAEHLEVEAMTADGRRVSVSFYLSGQLWEIEDDNHDKERIAEWRDLDPETIRRLVTDAGFRFGRVLEEKPRHVVVRATARDGANVILHMDREGYIYKQAWPRG